MKVKIWAPPAQTTLNSEEFRTKLGAKLFVYLNNANARNDTINGKQDTSIPITLKEDANKEWKKLNRGNPVANTAAAFRGASRCCCTTSDEGSCDVLRKSDLWYYNFIRAGLTSLFYGPSDPVCPEHFGYEHYTKKITGSAKVPTSCAKSGFNFVYRMSRPASDSWIGL